MLRCRGTSRCKKHFLVLLGMCCVLRRSIFVILWTVVVRQAPLFMEYSRQEYWIGLPFSPPGSLPKLGIEATFPESPALAGGSLALSGNFLSRPTASGHPGFV